MAATPLGAQETFLGMEVLPFCIEDQIGDQQMMAQISFQRTPSSFSSSTLSDLGLDSPKESPSTLAFESASSECEEDEATESSPGSKRSRSRLASTYFSLLSSRAAIVPLLPRVEDHPKNKDLYSGLVVFCERRLCLGRILRDLITADLQLYDDTVLFRETTPLLRLVTAFFYTFSAHWLKIFFKKPLALLNSSKIKKLTETQGQVNLFNDMVKLLPSMKKKLPLPVMKVLIFISKQLASERNISLERAFDKTCCATLFLRFCCPFLVSAALTVTDPAQRHGYLTSVKMLQCLASKTTIDSSVNGSPVFNAAITKAHGTYDSAMIGVLRVAQDLSTSGKLATPSGTKSKPDSQFGLSFHKNMQSAMDFVVWTLGEREFLLGHLPLEQKLWYASHRVPPVVITSLDLSACTLLFNYTPDELFHLVKL